MLQSPGSRGPRRSRRRSAERGAVEHGARRQLTAVAPATSRHDRAVGPDRRHVQVLEPSDVQLLTCPPIEEGLDCAPPARPRPLGRPTPFAPSHPSPSVEFAVSLSDLTRGDASLLAIDASDIPRHLRRCFTQSGGTTAWRRPASPNRRAGGRGPETYPAAGLRKMAIDTARLQTYSGRKARTSATSPSAL